jgi:hypothetical protein
VARETRTLDATIFEHVDLQAQSNRGRANRHAVVSQAVDFSDGLLDFRTKCDLAACDVPIF